MANFMANSELSVDLSFLLISKARSNCLLAHLIWIF